MTEADYYRYQLERTIGVICSPLCNTVYDGTGKYAIAGALEAVHVWNIRTGELVQRWAEEDGSAEAALIVSSPTDADTFAVGYSDGTVRLWSLKTGRVGLVFHGHKHSITALAFDPSGTRLASAARDNDIVIWDLISEMGLYRLHGHSNAVTGLAFTESGGALLSASKDTLVKVWDLATQHCVETNVLHHAEITSLVLDTSLRRLFTLGADNKLRIFALVEANVALKMGRGGEGEGEDGESANVLQLVETVHRSSNERVVHAVASKRYLAVLGADKSFELWKILREEEHKKLEGKKSQSWLKPVRYTRLPNRARSLAFCPEWRVKQSESIKFLAGFMDNQAGEMIVPLEKTHEISFPVALDSWGHRNDCKKVAFDQEGVLFATAAKQEVKIWNVRSGKLVRSVEIEDPTSLLFIPDCNALVIGDQQGGMHIADLVAGELVDSIKGHEGAVRVFALRPDLKGLMSGGDDKTIKMWEFKTTKGSSVGKKLKMIKSLQINDEIVALRYSPDLRYIAVASMDMTIKVFFEDSLRFYLSLYGHRLPVTGMDISSDGKLLISSSADKNIKVWSLEFGECQRSLHGHHEAITGVAFLSGTRRFVTCSKDKTIKYWDIEGYQELQKLSGHQGEIWDMALSKDGHTIITVSKDRSIRVWSQTEEMLFPEEEKEQQLEDQFERALIEDNPYEQEEKSKGVGRASTRTITSMKAGERIVECIEAADDERQKWDEYWLSKAQGLAVEEPTPGAFYLALGKDKSPAEFVLAAFEKIPLPDIEEALLCLPLNMLPSLLFYIQAWLDGRRNIVMAARILDMVLRLFHQSIIANPGLRVALEAIRTAERQTLQQLKDLIGYNAAAMAFA